MRLFIAIPFSVGMKKALRHVQEGFRARDVRGNYTETDNLHLTLAFIGEYGDPDRVLAAMETVDFAPLTLRLRGLGAFGDLWWVGLEDDPALDALAARLRRALAEAGIPFDRKKFAPHITLIRRAECRKPFSPGEIPVPGAEMRSDRVSLMLSTRGKHGMIYTELGAVDARE